MNDILETAARLLARARGRAITTRRTSALTDDPQETYGIAIIRVVGEEYIQAVAHGCFGVPPTVATDWDLTQRNGAHLEGLAASLDAYVARCLSRGQLPRLWLTEDIDLRCLELLGHRYHRNERADKQLQRLGWLCQALCQEVWYPGQQVMAVAIDVLRQHVITGQSAIDDLHVDALLAWLNPVSGRDPATDAAERALVPVAAMLPRRVDERIEALRAAARKGVLQAEAARAEIDELLTASVMREWQLLVAAREAYWMLGLQLPDSRISILSGASRRRLEYALSEPCGRPVQAHSLARQLDEQELAAEIVECLEICGDPVVREYARAAGRVMSAELSSMVQPRAGRLPCRITLSTRQQVLRVRAGTALQTCDAALQGKVVSIRESGGSTLIELDVQRGVRRLPALGATLDWTDAVVVDMQVQRSRAYKAMREASSPLVYTRQAPLVLRNTGSPSTTFLLEAATRLRQKPSVGQ